MAVSGVGRRTLAGLFKQACDEIPEVVGATGGMIVGLGFIGYGLYIYETRHLEKRKYKLVPVVVRPEDPRAQNIRK